MRPRRTCGKHKSVTRGSSGLLGPWELPCSAREAVEGAAAAAKGAPHLHDEAVHVRSVKGVLEGRQLVKDASHAPYVALEVVWFALENLRGHVVRGPCTERPFIPASRGGSLRHQPVTGSTDAPIAQRERDRPPPSPPSVLCFPAVPFTGSHRQSWRPSLWGP